MIRLQRHGWQNHGDVLYRRGRDRSRGLAMAFAIVVLLAILLVGPLFAHVLHG